MFVASRERTAQTRASHKLGGHSDGETPLPIPNREVKPASADGTRGAIPRESRTPPISSRKRPRRRGLFVVSGRSEPVAPLGVEFAQPAHTLAEGRVRGEERRKALVGERVRDVERLRCGARLERDELHGAL